MHDLLCKLIKQDIQPTFFGSKICGHCKNSLNNIESYYYQYRRAADAFLDKFTLGQKLLAADVVSAVDTSGSETVASYIDLQNVILKVIDPSLQAFNAMDFGANFQVR